jgi:hypothetical protein
MEATTPMVEQMAPLESTAMPTDLMTTEVAMPTVSEEVTAVAVASEPPFTPFPPEMLVGLKPAILQKLQSLESNLTKLSTASRGTVLENTYQRLLRAHARVENMLERRLVRRERFAGRGPRAQKFIKRHHARKTALLTNRYHAKVENIQQIRTAYQTGQISRQRASDLMTAVIRPGVQMPGVAAGSHPVAAAHPVRAQAVAAVAFPKYTLLTR